WTNSTWPGTDLIYLTNALSTGGLFITATQTASGNTSEFSAPAAPLNKRIAYVYSSDATARDSFAALLTARNYQVDWFTVTAADTADFTPYRAILIGHETGNLST